MQQDKPEINDPTLEKFNILIAQVSRLSESVEKVVRYESQSSTHTVIHRSSGVSAWGAAAITACFMTYLALILLTIWVVPQIHDLSAWKDVHQNHINALETKGANK